jgi:hypothetical protein
LSRIGILGGLCLATCILFADGGIVQFQKRAGRFVVTVFSSPVPLRVGPADLTVMVQTAEDHHDVLDCRVTLTLAKSGERDITLEATRAQATNKLLYAAETVLPSAGTWHTTVNLAAKSETASAAGDISVLPEQSSLIAYWPYFTIVPVALALFALNQCLKAKRRLNYPRARRSPRSGR